MASLRVQQPFHYILQGRGESYKWTLQGTQWNCTLYSTQRLPSTKIAIIAIIKLSGDPLFAKNAFCTSHYREIFCNVQGKLHRERHSAKQLQRSCRGLAEIMPRAGMLLLILIKRTLDPWSILQRVTQRLHRDSQSAKQLQRSGFSIFHLVSSRQSAVLKQILRNEWSLWFFESLHVKWLGIITKPETRSTYPICSAPTKFNLTIYVRRLLSPPA